MSFEGYLATQVITQWLNSYCILKTNKKYAVRVLPKHEGDSGALEGSCVPAEED